MKNVLPGITVNGPIKIGSVNNSAKRIQIKKTNLRNAKSMFAHKVVLSDIGCTKEAAQNWLIQHRMRSWKQKGTEADYYYDDWRVLWFADKAVRIEFLLCMHK